MCARSLKLCPSEVCLERVLGSGTLGLVYKGLLRGNPATVKILPLDVEQETFFEDFKDEIELPLFIRHPNLCLFMGYTLDRPIMIVDEFLERSLSDALQECTVKKSLPLRIRMAQGIALGINWLHRNHFVHLNLKPSNAFVYGRYSIKLADYNLKKTRQNLLSTKQTHTQGLPFWKAPEALFKEFRSILESIVSPDRLRELCDLYASEKTRAESCDIYSFAMLLWQLSTTREPYSDAQGHALSACADLHSYLTSVVVHHLRPAIEDVPSVCLRQLISDCWDSDSGKRPTSSGVLRSLNVALVDCVILDPLANQFWKSKVMWLESDEQIEWKRFCNLFAEFLGLTDPGSLGIVELIEIAHSRTKDASLLLSIRCLYALLVGKPSPNESVTLESFGQMVNRFGPISPRDRCSILARIRHLLSKPWFHGNITAKESNRKLLGKQYGTFLVRFSGSSQDEFTISKSSGGSTVTHHRIKRVKNPRGELQYILGDVNADTVDSLVDRQGEAYGLLIPLAGSQYDYLFRECPTPEDGYVEDTSGVDISAA